MKKLFACLTIVLCILCISAAAPKLAQSEGTYATTINDVDYTLVFEPGPFSPYEIGDAYLYDSSNKLIGKWDYHGMHLDNGIIKYDVFGLGLFMDQSGLMEFYTSSGVILKKVE
jgi:hypothetical protein